MFLGIREEALFGCDTALGCVGPKIIAGIIMTFFFSFFLNNFMWVFAHHVPTLYNGLHKFKFHLYLFLPFLYEENSEMGFSFLWRVWNFGGCELLFRVASIPSSSFLLLKGCWRPFFGRVVVPIVGASLVFKGMWAILFAMRRICVFCVCVWADRLS